jgi:hypothetical protein
LHHGCRSRHTLGAEPFVRWAVVSQCDEIPQAEVPEFGVVRVAPKHVARIDAGIAQRFEHLHLVDSDSYPPKFRVPNHRIKFRLKTELGRNRLGDRVRRQLPNPMWALESSHQTCVDASHRVADTSVLINAAVSIWRSKPDS